jgi:hypothetical protein
VKAGISDDGAGSCRRGRARSEGIARVGCDAACPAMLGATAGKRNRGADGPGGSAGWATLSAISLTEVGCTARARIDVR